jgi:hypothetical protein
MYNTKILPQPDILPDNLLFKKVAQTGEIIPVHLHEMKTKAGLLKQRQR